LIKLSNYELECIGDKLIKEAGVSRIGAEYPAYAEKYLRDRSIRRGESQLFDSYDVAADEVQVLKDVESALWHEREKFKRTLSPRQKLCFILLLHGLSTRRAAVYLNRHYEAKKIDRTCSHTIVAREYRIIVEKLSKSPYILLMSVLMEVFSRRAVELSGVNAK
jgi:hypothetical protein